MTIIRPLGAQPNDVLIAAVYWDNTRRPTTTAPTAWTLIRQDGSLSDQEVALYYHVATLADPVSFSWQASMSLGFTGIIAAYAGVSTTSPVDARAGQAGATQNAVAPSVTATSANEVVVAVWSAWNGNLTLTAPAGMTTRRAFGANNPLALADMTLTVSGATLAQTEISSANPAFWTGQTLALRTGP